MLLEKEDGWSYLYHQHIYDEAKKQEEEEKKRVAEESNRRTTRRSPRKSASTNPVNNTPVPYAVIRDEDKEEFRVGDIVRVRSYSGIPHIAMISEFSFGVEDFIHVRLLWFTRPQHVKRDTGAEPHEIFASWDSDNNILDVMEDKGRVLSREAFLKEFPDGNVPDNAKDREFFCRRAVGGSLNYLSKRELDWDNLYQQRDTDVKRMVETIRESVRETIVPGRPKRPREDIDDDNEAKNRKGGIDKTRKRLKFSKKHDDDDIALENTEEIGSAKKQNHHANDNDNNDSSSSGDEFYDAHENEDETDEGEEDDYSDSDVEQISKKRTLSPNKKSPQKKASSPSKPRAPRTKNKSSVAPQVKKARIPRDGRMFVKAPLKTAALPSRGDNSPLKSNHNPAALTSPHKSARKNLHVATIPESLPCRDDEFSQIFLALESAISSATGSCIYVSGTPGTGKTATVREAVAQLKLRNEDGELREFTFLEINGMKLVSPQDAYEILWEEVSGGQRVSSSNAMALLEKRFKEKDVNRKPIVVLMDELDQLVTKNQTVMYNFFNWPTLANSRLIVVAVANTMDLPERMLSNKISSRLGLTRIQFPGYSYDQIKQIIESRLEDIPGKVVEKDAVEFASRKIASVSGDARRALDICRRAVELAEPSLQYPVINGSTDTTEEENRYPVKISHIKQAINESINSPLYSFLRGLPVSSKIFLCAVLTRIRRSGVIDNSLADVLEETERLLRVSPESTKLTAVLFPGNKVRMAGFHNALAELVESGILVQQSMRGERSANIRLATGEEEVKSALMGDEEVEGMV